MNWTAIRLRDLARADHLGRTRSTAARKADLTITEDTAVYRSFANIRSADAVLRYALAVELQRVRRAARAVQINQ
jgi:hypothetical protein